MPIVMLLGPTGSGKTATALALAERITCRLISMDSALVYRGLDVGAAKPDAATRKRYPHALIDIRDPADTYSAAMFVEDADREVGEALIRGELPVLVGGTMLYARAFRDGLAKLPQASETVRTAIADRAATAGWPALHGQLAEVDPDAAAAIHPNNTQRLQRALEVYEISGRPISDFWRDQQNTRAQDRLGEPLLAFGILPRDREGLHQRIAKRFDAMLAADFAGEVRALRSRGDLHPDMPSLRAVGYRQMWQHLDGRHDAETMRAKALAATRQLAKKQLTWLRRWPALIGLDGQNPVADAERMLARLRRQA